MSSIACIQNAFILCYHSYHTFVCFTKSEPSKIQYLSIIFILLNFLKSLCYISKSWFPLYWSCDWIMKLVFLIGVYSSIMLYIVVLERLFLVFSDSQFAFKQTSIYSSRCLLMVYSISISFLVVFIGHGYYDNVHNRCLIDLPMWLMGVWGFIDIFICSSISILFARRLLFLNLHLLSKENAINISSATSTNVNEQMVDIMYAIDIKDITWTIVTKSTLLSMIALISSISFIVLVGTIFLFKTFLGTISSIDAIINVWCVMLMFSTHKKLYDKICKRMECCVSIKCLSYYSCTACCVRISTQSKTIKLEHSKTNQTVSTNKCHPNGK
eukprot:419796_1